MSALLSSLLLAAAFATRAGETQAPAAAVAQATPSAPASASAVPDSDEDLDTDVAEPDFHVITLPTNLRLPKHKLDFRLTHRFSRPLGQGDFSDLLADFFGFDSGAQIGFGLRFGIVRGTQLGIYRTNDKTIQFDLRQELLKEGGHPLGLSLVGSIEGLNNFGLTDVPAGSVLHEFSPAVTLVLSKKLGSRGAVYLEPSWVGNTRIVASAPGSEDATVVLGLGARLRLTGVLSLVGEWNPRLAGYAGDLGSGDTQSLGSFGLEWRIGGHAFQLNFSNGLGTTPAQVARGRQGLDGWFIGFNLTRKFY